MASVRAPVLLKHQQENGVDKLKRIALVTRDNRKLEIVEWVVQAGAGPVTKRNVLAERRKIRHLSDSEE